MSGGFIQESEFPPVNAPSPHPRRGRPYEQFKIRNDTRFPTESLRKLLEAATVGLPCALPYPIRVRISNRARGNHSYSYPSRGRAVIYARPYESVNYANAPDRGYLTKKRHVPTMQSIALEIAHEVYHLRGGGPNAPAIADKSQRGRALEERNADLHAQKICRLLGFDPFEAEES